MNKLSLLQKDDKVLQRYPDFNPERFCVYFESAWQPPLNFYEKLEDEAYEFKFDWFVECGGGRGDGHVSGGKMEIDNEEDEENEPEFEPPADLVPSAGSNQQSSKAGENSDNDDMWKDIPF